YGLPTENAAIKEKINPAILNKTYSDNYVRQFKLMGLSYDWSRLFNTADDSYYRWTQWIFLKLFESWYDPRQDKARPIAELERELAEQGNGEILDYIDSHPERVGAINKTMPRISAADWAAMSRAELNRFLMNFRLAFRSEPKASWWDPVDMVAVADEEVIDGRAWRSNTPVIKRMLRQWYFRMTAYSQRLIDDLIHVDWPDKIVNMQRNWVGMSQGAEVDFKVLSAESLVNDAHSALSTKHSLLIYTTRPDTLWGATFMVLSPEHPLVSEIVTDAQRAELEAYVRGAKAKSEDERTESKEKTGVFSGAYAINPVNNERIPIWIADYVLMTYGTGAIMAVPAHDQRDFEFARKFGLPVIQVVKAPNDEVRATSEWTEAYEAKEGVMVASGPITGMPAGQASIDAAIAYCEAQGVGKRRVNYRIRDWLISRQRYWGTPIPIVHTEDGEVAVPESELPLLRPDVQSYAPTPTGESPLADIPEYVNVASESGPNGKRETDTLATWACSSWYYMRFPNPNDDTKPFDYDELKYWLPVDMYVGGAEHAVLHLLYSRMWTKVLYDLGYVPFVEPFKSLRNQGMILSPQQVTDENGRTYYEKMSKSKGNVITPDEVVAEHGADALRGYEMFISDFAATVPWSTQGVPGVRRWLDRAWRIVLAPDDERGQPQKFTARELRRVAHQTIQRYERDAAAFSFNTVISGMMEFTNTLFKARDAGLVGTPEWSEAIDILVRLLAPIAPHMAEELWARRGCAYSIHQQSWPRFDAAAAKEDEITIPVQVNGKVRDRVTVPAETDDEAIKAAALSAENVRKFLDGKTPKQVIYVKGRMVSVVL
ncbi:MAG: leucine--tRNA ligase, partial [Anaerolineae bacterium]|nr:leucine--tRNA ligase [Anaerolineae bacterium]